MNKHGVTGLEILLIVFITLKLTGTIAWSWWWVMSPFWIPLVLVVIAGVLWVVSAGLRNGWK